MSNAIPISGQQPTYMVPMIDPMVNQIPMIQMIPPIVDMMGNPMPGIPVPNQMVNPTIDPRTYQMVHQVIYPMPIPVPTSNPNLNDSNAIIVVDTTAKTKEQPQKLQIEEGLDFIQGLLNKLKTRNSYLVGILLIAVIMIASTMGACIALVPRGNKSQGGDNQNIPVNVLDQACNQYQSLCSGVPDNVTKYISANFNTRDKVLSAIQVSNSINKLKQWPDEKSRNSTLQDVDRITASVQCLMYHLPNDYIEAYQTIIELQITQWIDFHKYLNMSFTFSERSYTLKPRNDLVKSCLFSTSSARLLENAPPVFTDQTNCTKSSYLMYFTGLGYGPIAVLRNLYKINETLAQSTSTTFNGVVAVGVHRNWEFYDNSFLFIYREVYAQLEYSGYQISQFITLWKIMMRIVNGYNSLKDISKFNLQNFGTVLEYYQKSIINLYTQTNASQILQIRRHTELVFQLVRQGRKIVFLAHGNAARYANRVYETLGTQEKKSVALAYIAPFGIWRMAAGYTNYISNPYDDLLYRIGNTFYIEPNVGPKIFTDSRMNNSLIGYLSNYKQQFISIVSAAKSRALAPNATFDKGLFSVYMKWDPVPGFNNKITLHVQQPYNNFSTYSYPRYTNNLVLEYDGVSWQHYASYCRISQGNYTIRANHFSGNLLTDFYVTAVVGDSFFTAKLTSKTPMGAAGIDNPPIFVCKISVKYNSQTKVYDAKISQSYS